MRILPTTRSINRMFVLPVTMLTALTLLIVASSLYFNAREVDRRALQRQQLTIQNVVNQHSRSLTRELKLETIWGEAYQKTRERDHAWMDSSFGEFFTEILGYSAVYVLADDDTSIYAHENDAERDAKAFETLRPSIAHQISAVRSTSTSTSLQVTETEVKLGDRTVIHRGSADLTTFQDRPVVVTVTTIQPDDMPENGLLDKPYLLVAIQPIDETVTAQLGNTFGFEGLQWAKTKPNVNLATVEIKSSTGQPVGLLTWTRDRPGFDIAKVMAKGLGAAFTLLILLSALFVSRGRKESALLNARTEELHELNATLERRVLARTKELEQASLIAKHASAAKSQFLANMSHEIRTPMNGVFGMTDLLMRTGLDSRQTKLVRTINESAKSLLTIINDILDLSRIESGKLELETHEFNLRESIEQTIDLFATQADAKGIALSVFVDPSLPNAVIGDSGRLKQILLNLTGNALKFTEHGEVNIHVTEIGKGIGKSTIRFVIRDTGIGIGKDTQEKLFQPFSQAESSISRRFGGTGLGLSIARHLANLMGGDIGLESELGNGTTVTIEIPFEHGAAKLAINANDYAALAGARILVIDDRDSNREIVAAYLNDCGSTVTAVASTAAADEALADAELLGKPFHAALVDMMMPDENGLQFAKRIKNSPSNASIKLLILSSMSWHGDLADIRDAGIDSVLTKPIRRKDLVDAAARAISGCRHQGWQPDPEIAAAAVDRSGEAVSVPAVPSTLRAHVLVAEDNPVNIEVIKEFLSALGCTYSIAVNGLEAVTFYRSQPFDLVLMDCQMPIMDGISAARRIRAYELENELPQKPILAVTANAFAEDRNQCFEAGMNDYLSKPYSEQQIAELIHRWHAKHDGEIKMPSARSQMPRRDTLPADVVCAETIDAAHFLAVAEEPVRATVQTPTKAAVDLDVLATLRKSRPDLLARLVKTYIAYAPQALSELAKASEALDFETMTRLAHSLKSSSANLGANELSALCRSLEVAGKARQIDLAQKLVADIEANFADVRRALDDLAVDTAAETPRPAKAVNDA
jgi:two-component system, sensor histidine kinase and response regulator